MAIDPELRAAARRLLAASGFRARQEALLDDSLEAARAELVEECINRAAAGGRVDCPASQPAGINKERRAHMLDAIIEAAVTVYAKTFSNADMDRITTFFGSEVGRRYSKAYPPMLSRIQAIKRRLLMNELRFAKAGPASGAKP